MRLAGLSEKTQSDYVGAVFRLSKYYARSPDQLEDEEIRRWFVHLSDERGLAPSTLRVYIYGTKFFYQHTLGREVPVLDFVKAQKVIRLPEALTHEQVCRVLEQVREPTYHMALCLTYACGLRRKEVCNLTVDAVNGTLLTVHIRRSKGNKDRYVPLPGPVYKALRAYWAAKRPPKPWLFVNRVGKPLNPEVLNTAFKKALAQSPVEKKATLHILRHSYATTMLQTGASVYQLMACLGHGSLTSTVRYLHLLQGDDIPFRKALDGLMSDLF